MSEPLEGLCRLLGLWLWLWLALARSNLARISSESRSDLRGFESFLYRQQRRSPVGALARCTLRPLVRIRELRNQSTTHARRMDATLRALATGASWASLQPAAHSLQPSSAMASLRVAASRVCVASGEHAASWHYFVNCVGLAQPSEPNWKARTKLAELVCVRSYSWP